MYKSATVGRVYTSEKWPMVRYLMRKNVPFSQQKIWNSSNNILKISSTGIRTLKINQLKTSLLLLFWIYNLKQTLKQI